MSVLLSRLFLATALVATPALAQSDAQTPETDAAPTAATEAETEADAPESEGETAEAEDVAAEDAAENDAEKNWAEKLRQRHHEGDVALGVCGARMSVLMWFYQSSVADGRDDLQPALDAITESRAVIKGEAERRAVEDGVGTSVSVMNEYSEKYWLELVQASEEPENFQAAYDDLFNNVQECLSLFFNRGAAAAETEEPKAPEPEAPAEEKAE